MRVKTLLRQSVRTCSDLLRGRSRRFASSFIQADAVEPYPIRASENIALINPAVQAGMFNAKVHNIRLAASRMNGLVIQPRELFSFWRCAGRPTISQGYQMGSAFLNRRMSKDVGGGICQLSTAIFVAGLRTGLSVTERFPHSIDAYGEQRYFTLGQDATVAYGYKDLRLANSYKFPVVLGCGLKDNVVYAQFHAPRKTDTITLSTRILETIPPSVVKMNRDEFKKGKYLPSNGSTGKRVQTTRIIKKLDTGQSKNEQWLDTYHPLDIIETLN